ncbi:DUF3599 family protein [Alkalicoccobacillus gibsonii]|uniref:DUF3599 family protein n=1 Tax=Alkalicoccobacillus gibsonii TaxID=79881 RepID=UPI0019340790|nr:DUF3599 family protein [Alkalicoccobacillus gibsonii]MBM0064933.1 DUF3599 family protein [Alkalicoccobacillus gibsonii]
MSLENFLVHTCDVFRLVAVAPKKSYGIEIEQPNQSAEEPVYTGVPCYFQELTQDVVQGQPHTTFVQRMRVTFPAGTDIKLNDTVKWSGATYKLQQPKDVRGHHIIVTATRSDAL